MLLLLTMNNKHNFQVNCSSFTAQLLAIVEGELGAGNYSHYTMHEHGHYKIVLQSVRGDADLYMSDKSKRADFYNYDWQSTTYGLDEIEITPDMTRPIAVSVYAHPYYSTSVFILSKYLITSNEKNYETHCAESNENFKDFYSNSMLRQEETDSESSSSYASSESRQQYQQQHRSHSSYQKSSNKNNLLMDDQDDEGEYENESVLWTILIHLLKLIAEIVL